jgi:4-carboxymuconolactone decarboxylase
MNQEKYERGMAARRQVMGDIHVDKSLNSATDFTRPMQKMVTEICWGEVWVRETITKKTRSLITIATLAALKAPIELKGHVKGALRNGCSIEEIQEVLLHSAVYCGMPAGIDAFRAAQAAIEEWHSENG